MRLLERRRRSVGSIRCSAATSASTCSCCRSCSGCSRSRCCRSCCRWSASASLYVSAGRLGLSFAEGIYVRPPALGAPLGARRALARSSLAFGAWLSIPGAPHHAVGHRPRRVLRGRPRAHAGAARAEHRLGARRAARGLSGVSAEAVADRHGRRALCRRFDRRRWPTPPILQRFVVAPNEQTRETPYHRPQHRGDARGVRAANASTSASCPATPS